MKKFLPYIVILMLSVGLFMPAMQPAYAQTAQQDPNYFKLGQSCPEPGGPNVWKIVGGKVVCTTQSSVTETVTNAVVSLAGGWLNPLIGDLFFGILKFIWWITWLAGYLLNYVLDYTIINMKVHISGGIGTDKVTYLGLTGINIAWKVIRDLMNIGFIFMLVYEGILLIIGQGNTARIKKFITGIVLASLLINFSLFFTKVMIDASNIITIGFYNSILGTKYAAEGKGLSDPISEGLGISTTLSADADPTIFTGKSIGQVFITGFGTGIILLVASFVFFAISFVFIIRYLVLLILLMLSPVAYMGMALPFMEKYAKDWWKSFRSQLLFGPIYMIMTWVVLILMNSPGFIRLADNNGFNQLLANTAAKPSFGTMGLLVNYTVIIGLLIASLVIAKSAASEGDKRIGQATGQLTAWAGGAVSGGAARLSRNTLGRAGNSMANDEDLKDRAQQGGVRGSIARMQLAAANRAATSTFDTRATGTFGAIAGAAGMKNAFGKVDTKKENFRAEMEERDKQATKRAERYKTSDLAKQDAERMLNQNTEGGKRFRDEENARRKAREMYVNSDDYKESDEYKKIQEAEDNNRRDKIRARDAGVDIRGSEQKLETLTREMDTFADNTPQKAEIRARIETLKKENAKKNEILRGLEKNISERDKFLKESAFDVNTWMSDERKNLIARAGGTKKEKGDGGVDVYKDAAGNVIASGEVKSAYEQRTNATAARTENTSAAWRYTANTVGVVTNAVGLTAIPRTKRDRQELGRKTRKLASKKTAEQEAKELIKKMGKEAKERGEKDDDEDETPPAPAAPAPEAPPADGGTA